VSRIATASRETIAEAAQILRAGGLVAFPTETVYGLGADATQAAAIARLYAAKGRPAINPLIVHIAGPKNLADHAMTEARAERVAEQFWPGPLTLVLRRRADCKIVPAVSAGRDTIALRSPDHPVAAALIAAADRPLAAPSANPSGRPSPTTAAHVRDSLGDRVDLILDGGACRVGLESTVLDLTGPMPVILRPGAITDSDLAPITGKVTYSEGNPAEPSAPGQLLKHYAPVLPLRLHAATAHSGEALLAFGRAPEATLNLSPAADLQEAARNLFAMLRALDDPARFKGIAVMPIPDEGLGRAINDRLRRAAARD
jgi:L-threonylcarbamoyladenylate synthase